MLRQTLTVPDFSDGSTSYRNNYITARMYAIDLLYSEYEASLTRERQDTGVAADVLNIGLTSSATLIGAVATKNILTTAAAGLTGVKTSYNDNILLNRTVQVLQSQMRANRAIIAARIIAKMPASTSLYPLAAALSDLEDYYRAGTVTGALLGVTASVARVEDQASVDKEATVNRVLALRTPIERLPPLPPPSSLPTRISGFERSLTEPGIETIQRALCIRPVTGVLDTNTRRGLVSFFDGFGSPRPAILTSGLAPADIGPIDAAVSMIGSRDRSGDCFKARFKSPGEVGRSLN